MQKMKTKLSNAEATRAEATRSEATRAEATRAEATRARTTQAEATRAGTIGSLAIKYRQLGFFFLHNLRKILRNVAAGYVYLNL